MEPSPSPVAVKHATPRLGRRAIPRNRLIARLVQEQHRKLALITGSAGFGKTMLMAQWRRELVKSGADVVWLALALDDNALPRFCATLHAALQWAGLLPDADQAMPGASERAPHEVARILVNALARSQRELYLLIDDVHHITDAATIALMQALVDATFPS
ncbi:AAA family ATPase [Cupriavidus basilensis]|uniref:AAA family ATPase n=1 Tax=Cupriavidus basilensis TaxID=68895 RepID=UPI0005BAFE2C|nr:AAA family ATPase [Cupriavidus basilensis]